MNIKAIARILLLGLLLTAPAAVTAENRDPETIVKETTEKVLQELRAYEGDLEQDPEFVYDLVRQEVLPNINMRLVTRFALGRHWNDATEEQREQIREEITTLLVRTYSEPLLDYGGEEVRYRSASVDEERGRASMRVEVDQPDGPSIPLTYQFREHDRNGWQVYDVVVEGVSLVTSYRDSFSSEIRRNGVDGLLERLKKRNERGETEL